ncbi:Rhodanese-like domain-containing protein [Fimicolochytrium jonesii]|uniref:Rhodanese-like domain-containing protein n=1 Tax=Fimicolochytrium jonesii TaxID=1396493 RepID=UPI0022FE1768|nr:Rhodanese-like domain-containing protein [Fimicolochytrium jonesii]KAI8817773.1 Rhodanese-like domain-containing protein [Fimicolochytrium jonesii]
MRPLTRASPAMCLRAVAVHRIPATRSFATTTPRHSLFASYLNTVRKNVKEITPQQLNAKLASAPQQDGNAHTAFHVLDVREPQEWNKDCLPYALYTGRGCLERDIEGIVPDPYDNIVVYCAGGVRSILAADALQKMGYKNVASLSGGISQWKQDGYPLGKAHQSFSPLVAYE